MLFIQYLDYQENAAKYKLTHEMQQSLRTIKSSARFSQLSPIHKSLRVKVAGLGILSTFFDAYKAASAFIALSTTTDAKGRQDLMVKGGLHTAAALIGTGMTVASLIGGTAAAVGGPVGLALVIALYITAEIYVISRQIEVIERYVKDLNIGEKFSIIITTFLGMGLDVSIDNRFRLNQIQEQLEKQRDDQLEKYINKKMISNDAIGTLYVSRRQVTQTRHFYREVVGKGPFGREYILKEDILQETDINLEAIKISHSCPLFILVGKDLINDRHRHDSLEVRNSKRFYSIPGPLLETDDHIDSQVSHRSQHVVAQTFIGAREKVGQFVDEQGISLITDPHFHVNDYYNVMGDFNGDGQRDIGYISMQGAYYLLADGKGGYGDRQKLTVSRKNKPGQPERVEDLKMIFESTVFTLVGNINGDKLDDIVIMDASRGIRILLAQENGHFKEIFQTVTFAALSYKNPAIPVLMDIDQDGHADLVSFTRGTRPSTRKGKIDIHYGTASGTFESGRSQSLASLYKLEKRRTLPEHSSYTHSVTGDINGDGYGDIVLFTETGAIYTLLGRKKDRNNPFEAIPVQLHDGIKNLQSSFKRRQIQLRDINGDGCDDLLVIQNNGSYSLSYGKPEGTFSDETTDERRGGEHYRPNILAVKFQRQILGIGAGTDGKPALLSLNKQGEVNAHPLDPTPTNEIVALFDLGGGSDTVVGHQDQQNSFNVAAGRKHFTGGRYKDRFFLLGQAVPETPSVFKGARDGDDHPQDNADILIADAKPMGGHRGYYINLKEGFVKYIRQPNRPSAPDTLASLYYIDHAKGHGETDDILVGNDNDNELNGAGGNDYIIGHGGNDRITLQQGRAEGGEGIDTYHILQHQDSEHRSIELTETIGMGEYSNILLDYRAEQIISISRRNTDVFLLLRNDRTDSNSHPLMTHLKLRNLYGPRQNNNKRVLQHNYRLETRDRSPLSGWLENIIDDNDHDLSKLIDTMSHFSSHAENNSRLEDVSSSYRSNPTFFTTEGKYAK